jgi:hypothetical protein
MTDWRDEVRDSVARALSEGEAVVPRDVASPAQTERVARVLLARYGHEDAIGYEPSEAGVKLVRTDYWKPEMRLGPAGDTGNA